MIRKFILSLSLLICAVLFQRLTAQLCTPDTSLHKAGYKPAKLPVVAADSQYNESLTVLVKRDTFKMVGAAKVNVKIDSVKATSVLGLPSGYSYQCQHPRCVFLWDTVKCVRIFGKTSVGGTFPILIPVVGYAKIGSSSFKQNDTIRDFTLIVTGGTAGRSNLERIHGWKISPNPASDILNIYSTVHSSAKIWSILNLNGQKMKIQFLGDNGVYSANISSLIAGVYFVSNGIDTRKLIISPK